MRSTISSHSSSLVLALLKFMPDEMRASLLLPLPQIFMLLISLVNDWVLKRLCKKFEADWSSISVIYATSYVTLIYFARTFSNCLETAIFSILLYLTLCSIEFKDSKNFTRKKLHENRNTHSALIAMTLVVGIFLRPTFVIFAAVPILLWLYKSGSISKAITVKIFPMIIPALLTSFSIIFIDTLYYRKIYFINFITNLKRFAVKDLLNLVITPINFVTYNFQTKNLANHGLHPYFLHWLVNVPLVFTILGIYATYDCLKTGINYKSSNLNALKLALNLIWIIPVCGLSIFPHQEPRFLIPLLLPIVLVNGPRIYKSNILFTLWVLGNFGTGFFYGVLHQGGIAPCLFHLSKIVPETSNQIELIFFRTYLPPRYLMQLDRSDTRVKITDVGEKELEDLVSIVQSTLKSTSPKTDVYTIIPGSISSSVNFMKQIRGTSDNKKFVLSRAQYFFPHLCTEDLPNIKLLYTCATTNCNFWGIFRQQLSLQMYKVSYLTI